MTPALGKLIEISGAPFVRDYERVGSAVDHLGSIGTSIREVLARKNCFFCFEAALRFFPSITVDSSWSILDWNSHNLWKGDYRGGADNIFCFAEEIFGRQFVVHEEKIAIFESETGDMEVIASSLEEWASKVLLDYREMTGHPIAHEWQSLYGALHPRHRLIAKRPFVLGGQYSVENLVSLDSVRVMKSLGNLAHQIQELPDGAQVEFKIL